LQLSKYRANQAVRDEQSRPYVVADFEPSAVASRLFDFVIRNIGTTPAFDVEIRLDPTPERAREINGHLLAKSRIFDGTLPMLAPSRELRLFFDSMPRRYKAGLAMSFKVTIAYKNKRGKEFNEDTVTDMDIARGSVQFEVYGVHHLAKSLRAIEKTQKKIADHLRNPIQVTTEDWKAHDERMKEDEAEMRAAGSCSAGSGVICGSGVTLLGVSA